MPHTSSGLKQSVSSQRRVSAGHPLIARHLRHLLHAWRSVALRERKQRLQAQLAQERTNLCEIESVLKGQKTKLEKAEEEARLALGVTLTVKERIAETQLQTAGVAEDTRRLAFGAITRMHLV